MEVLRLTGFRTWSEFIGETTPEERVLIAESISAWHDAQDGGGGGGGAMPGMGL